MNIFDAVVYHRRWLIAVDHRLQYRPAAQRRHDPGLSRRDADRDVGDVAASPAADAAASSPRVAQNSLLFFGIILVAGMVLGKLARMALDETIGSEAGIGDRLAGALLGAVRVGLVAVTLCWSFDQLVPAERQPAFLTGSQLRPLLSAAGQKGFKSLPPELTASIDRLKREPADIASHRPDVADMHFGRRAATYQGRPTWLQWPIGLSKNHLT